MKRKKSLIFLTLAIMLLFSITANAKIVYKDKVRVLKPGVYTKKDLPMDDYIEKTDTTILYNNYYQITVPADGYITVTLDTDPSFDYLTLYDSLKAANKDDSCVFEQLTKKTNIVLEKGIYYFKEPVFYRLKYTFTKAKNLDNYKMSKAVPLGKNKTVTVCMTPQHFYARWYKITLTKKQAINVYLKSTDLYCEIWNSKKELTSEKKGKRIYTYVQPKGTYYIRIPAHINYPFNQFYWK